MSIRVYMYIYVCVEVDIDLCAEDVGAPAKSPQDSFATQFTCFNRTEVRILTQTEEGLRQNAMQCDAAEGAQGRREASASPQHPGASSS